MRDRLPASGCGEAGRSADLRPIRPDARPHGLHCRGFQLPRVLRNHREAPRRNRAAARPIHPRHHDRVESDYQPPAVAGHPRSGHRCDDRLSVRLPGARRDPQDFRKLLTTHMFRIGGTQYEIYDGFQDQVRTFINDFPHKVDEYETLLTENRIWLERTRGVGVLSAKDAIDLGVTGPALRGSGVEWDIRKAKPYAAYADFQFDIPVGEHGDTY